MKIRSFLFLGVALVVRFAGAETLSPDVKVTEQDVTQAIQSIRQETTPDFWTMMSETHIKSVSGEKLARTGLVTAGGTLVGYSAITETAMLVFKTSDPLLANAKLNYLFLVGLETKALKYIAPNSVLYKRYLAKSLTYQNALAAMAARGTAAKHLTKVRWGIRAAGAIGGGIIGATVMMFPDMISTTASSAQDEMGEAFYESSAVMAEALANPHLSDEQLLETARRYPGFGVNLVAIASSLEQLMQAKQ